MPIAIIPEHQALADSVRSLVARIAPSEVLHAALETTLETPIENPPPYWQAAAEQGLLKIICIGETQIQRMTDRP